MKPLYNRLLRQSRNFVVVYKSKNKEKYNTCSIRVSDSIDHIKLSEVVGVFRSKKQATEHLARLANAYTLCPKLLGIEKTKTHCFSYTLKKCNGACMSEELYLKYNLRFDEACYKFKLKAWPFKGPIAITEKNFERVEQYIFDKWCFVGHRGVGGKNMFDIQGYQFDFETYKILVRQILTKRSERLHIEDVLLTSESEQL